MNCNEFKKEINNFIDNSIDMDVVDDFIKHYKTCKNCNEELEIYYMVNKTFKNDSANADNTVSVPDSYDFKKRLNNKISYYDELIYNRYKAEFFMKLTIFGTEIISLAYAVYFIIKILGGNNVW